MCCLFMVFNSVTPLWDPPCLFSTITSASNWVGFFPLILILNYIVNTIKLSVFMLCGPALPVGLSATMELFWLCAVQNGSYSPSCGHWACEMGLLWLEGSNLLKIDLLLATLGLWCCVCVCVCVFSFSVLSDSLWPFWLSPVGFFSPRDFSGKNTGVGSYFLL